MDTDSDYRTLTERQLAEQLTASVAELEDQHTTDTLTADAIIEQVDQRRAVIIAERDAIAVVRPEGYRPAQGDPVLWLLLVKSNSRGKGIGKAFVLDLRRRFERSMPMILVCNGASRESFFAACGFRLKERLKDGSAVMCAELSTQHPEAP